jgi:hypothetical protein
MMGKDHTIFAVEDGMVHFDRSATRARICIVPVAEVPEGAEVKSTRRTRKYAKCVPEGVAAARAPRGCGAPQTRGSGGERSASLARFAPRRSRARAARARPGSRRATPPPRSLRLRAEHSPRNC